MKPSTASANASTVTRSRIFVMLGLVPRQVAKKVKGPRDEDWRLTTGAGERSNRIRLDLDLGKVVGCEPAELGSRERTGV